MKPLTKSLISFLKIIVSFIFIYFIIRYVGKNEIFDNFRRISSIILFFIAVLSLFNITLQYFRWKIFATKIAGIDTKTVFKSLFVGITGAFMAPLGIGDFLGRAATKKDKITEIIAATMYDKIFISSLIIAFGFPSLIYFFGTDIFNEISIKGILILTALIIFFTIIIYFISKSNFILIRKEKLLSVIKLFFNSFNKFDKKDFLLLIFLSFFQVFIYNFQLSLLLSAFENVEFKAHFLVLSISFFFVKNFFPKPFIAEIGYREFIAIIIFTNAGFSEASAFNSSVVLYTFNVIFPAILGYFLFIRIK